VLRHGGGIHILPPYTIRRPRVMFFTTPYIYKLTFLLIINLECCIGLNSCVAQLAVYNVFVQFSMYGPLWIFPQSILCYSGCARAIILVVSCWGVKQRTKIYNGCTRILAWNLTSEALSISELILLSILYPWM